MAEPQAPDFFRSIADCAASVGFSPKTLYRRIAAGDGPTVMRLSPNRMMILDSHWHAWLKAREEPPAAHLARRLEQRNRRDGNQAAAIPTTT